MKLLPALITAAIVAAACTEGDRTTAVPRRRAYPRVEIADSSFHPVTTAYATVEVNDACTVATDRPGWLRIDYPEYSAALFLTTTDFGSDTTALVRAIENRRDRVGLNIGDAPSTVETVETDGWIAYIISSPEARQTPLHIIASDGRSRLVSGAVWYEGVAPDAPVDSLSPSVKAMHRDLLHLASTLK